MQLFLTPLPLLHVRLFISLNQFVNAVGDVWSLCYVVQVVITYISYLCTRLLDLRHECRAARVIQAAWREHRVRRGTTHLQQRHVAAARLQRAVRVWLRRRRLERQGQRRHSAVVSIQAWFRGFRARRLAAKLLAAQQEAECRKAATRIQVPVPMIYMFYNFMHRYY